MSLPDLNFPKFEFRFQKNAKGNLQVFDAVRKKFVDLTPEEWVRQHLIQLLNNYHGVPLSMMSVEKQLILNGTKRRTDLVVFNSLLKPVLVAECKAPEVKLNQETVNQALRYNLQLKVPAVLLSNGLNHVFFTMNPQPEILNHIPDYKELLTL